VTNEPPRPDDEVRPPSEESEIDAPTIAPDGEISVPQFARDWHTEVSVVAELEAGARPAPGTVVGDDFEIIRFLAQGGMGHVHIARDLKLGRRVAVKLVRPVGAHWDAALKAFEREARATARLRHPNIVTIHQFGNWNGLPFLVLELLEGEALDQVLRRRPVTTPEVVRIGVQIARALVHAHRMGLVHRDLKLGNVFLTEDDTIKVLDFGLSFVSARLDTESTTAPEPGDHAHTPGVVSGTPGYMPPEQALGASQDERVDIWALGAVLFRLTTQRMPFSRSGLLDADLAAPEMTEFEPEAPAALDRIVQRALAKAPGRRFQSAQQMLDELLVLERRLLGGDEVVGEPYRYLQSYGADDAAWFFGRDREAARAVRAIKGRRLLALVGPSGAGKSSLVHAGIAPLLRHDSERWTVLSLAPGPAPLTALHHALSHALEGGFAKRGPGALLTSPGLAGRALRRIAEEAHGRVLLVVDQFEELYTQVTDRADRVAFTSGLLSAADDESSPVSVLLVMRSDFIHRCTEDPVLGDRVTANLMALGPPGHDALIRTLEGPAARLGYELESGLAEQMVNEVQGVEAPLPLLQFAVSRLWEHRDTKQRLLMRESLLRLGGVAGVLAAHAEHVYGELVAQPDVAVARAMLCALVTADGTRMAVARSELIADFEDRVRAERVLTHLLDGRLLTTGRGGDGVEAVVQIAHESLIARWQRLAEWLSDSAGERRHMERLGAAVRHWSERGRPAQLLWRGESLEDALRWRRESAPRLGADERAFLDAALSARNRSRRIRLGAAVVSVVVLVAVALGSYATMLEFRERGLAAERAEGEARHNQGLAESRQAELIIRTLTIGAESHRLRDQRTEAVALLRAAADLEVESGGATSNTVLDIERLASVGGMARVLPGHAEVDEVLFSPDGRQLATLGAGKVTLWEVATGTALHTLSGHVGRMVCMAWGPGGQWFATGALDDPEVRIWGPKRTLKHRLGGPGERVRTLTPSPDRRLLAAAQSSVVRVLPYMMARSLAPGEGLGVAQAIITQVGKRVVPWPSVSQFYPGQPKATEAVINAVTLLMYETRTGQSLSETTCKAVADMWKSQRPDGGFDWWAFGLFPFELSQSNYWAAALVSYTMAAAQNHPECDAASSGSGALQKLHSWLADNLATADGHGKLWYLVANRAWGGGLISGNALAEQLAAIRAKQRDDGGFGLTDFLPLDPATASDAYASAIAGVVLDASQAPEDKAAAHDVRAWMALNGDVSTLLGSKSPNKPDDPFNNALFSDTTMAFWLWYQAQ